MSLPICTGSAYARPELPTIQALGRYWVTGLGNLGRIILAAQRRHAAPAASPSGHGRRFITMSNEVAVDREGGKDNHRSGARPLPGIPEPCYYVSLTVSDVRCFRRKQVLPLTGPDGRPAPLTVIIGDNGVGKTTLLQCLAALQPVSVRQGRETHHSIVISKSWTQKGGFGLSELAVHGRAMISSMVWLGALGARDGNGRQVRGYSAKRVRSIQFSYSHSDPAGGPVCYSYGAGRRLGQVSLIDNTIGLSEVTGFADEPLLINAEEWLLQADYAVARQVPKAKERQDRINGVLREVLPGVSDIRIQAQTTPNGAPYPQFETKYGWVGFDHLSLGYRSTITWMVDLAARMFDRYPESPNPLWEPAIVLIDEIDLHLHPQWQRVVLRLITDTFPHVQFVVTTHSPLVVQAAEAANVVLLRREDDHVIIETDVSTVRGWRVDQILTSELFDLPTARPESLDPLLGERNRILAKARPSRVDRARLREIEQIISELPWGESRADIDAQDIIKRAAALLSKSASK
jgi:predicted ATP-binding protein involved in virulence